MNLQTNTIKNSIKNQINSQTFLQKLLGQNYKWWFIIRYSLISETGGKIGFIFGYISAIARVVSSNYVWFLAGSGAEVFTYLLVGRIYSQISNNLYYYQLSYLIHTGNLTSKLMYSTNFFLDSIFVSNWQTTFQKPNPTWRSFYWNYLLLGNFCPNFSTFLDAFLGNFAHSD